jgi:hypothetical protein
LTYSRKKWAANGQQEQIEPMIELAEKPRKQLMMKEEKNGAGEETRTLDSHLGKGASLHFFVRFLIS